MEHDFKAALEGALEDLRDIASASTALRSGGPDPMDLQELSDSLEAAVDIAASRVKMIEAALSVSPVEGDAA